MTSPADHIERSWADDVAWAAGPIDDGFDEAEMERAMLKARQEAYQALGDLDAA